MPDLTPPPEPAGGQDDEPPDALLAVRATLTLLADVIAARGRPLDDDLMLRLFALQAVLRRLRDHLEDNRGRRRRRWWLTLGSKP